MRGRAQLGAVHSKSYSDITVSFQLTVKRIPADYGPLVPELKEMFPDAPYIARPGQINAWDNEDFVKAIKATGCKQRIIAGVVTDVCVAFPTLSALAAR